MIDEQTLQAMVQRIMTVAQPCHVILFGSYGRGNANGGSDMDLMVINPEVRNPYTSLP